MATIARETEVLVPASRDEAVDAFGDGQDVTVVAGATILMPEIVFGRLRPRRALLLARAGLDEITRRDGGMTIGAATPLTRIAADAPEPLATLAGHVGDPEIRSQATIGGNLCAPPGPSCPRGDLQAALLALEARVRSVGDGGERVEDVEDFLATGPDGRLVLELEVDEPRQASAQGLGRPHTHSYTALAVACAETAGGVRVAVAGAGPRAQRCRGVEDALAGGASAADAAAKALEDVTPDDDAIASGWYRGKTLPLLVERALVQLEEAR